MDYGIIDMGAVRNSNKRSFVFNVLTQDKQKTLIKKASQYYVL
jgi:hypothetical protein